MESWGVVSHGHTTAIAMVLLQQCGGAVDTAVIAVVLLQWCS
jgi:hypothetical protein